MSTLQRIEGMLDTSRTASDASIDEVTSVVADRDDALRSVSAEGADGVGTSHPEIRP
ncbi:MAG: hypothetical protein ACRDF0_05755 [Candidatus Limnocylindria bacterium]